MQLWKYYSWQQHLRHIVVEDKATADDVRRELISGRITWAAAVKKYSVAKSDLGADGDIGWLTPDKMDPNLAVRVYGIKPGETSQPVQDKDGWNIVQSIERKHSRLRRTRSSRSRCASSFAMPAPRTAAMCSRPCYACSRAWCTTPPTPCSPRFSSRKRCRWSRRAAPPRSTSMARRRNSRWRTPRASSRAGITAAASRSATWCTHSLTSRRSCARRSSAGKCCWRSSRASCSSPRSPPTACR